jgi:hypothetical protein
MGVGELFEQLVVLAAGWRGLRGRRSVVQP